MYYNYVKVDENENCLLSAYAPPARSLDSFLQSSELWDAVTLAFLADWLTASICPATDLSRANALWVVRLATDARHNDH